MSRKTCSERINFLAEPPKRVFIASMKYEKYMSPDRRDRIRRKIMEYDLKPIQDCITPRQSLTSQAGRDLFRRLETQDASTECDTDNNDLSKTPSTLYIDRVLSQYLERFR